MPLSRSPPPPPALPELMPGLLEGEDPVKEDQTKLLVYMLFLLLMTPSNVICLKHVKPGIGGSEGREYLRNLGTYSPIATKHTFN